MKKTMTVLAIVFLASIAAYAQEGSGAASAKGGSGDYDMGQEIMGGEGYGMGPGMMGGGGYGMMRQGMMGGGGYGMGHGMMGPGYYGHTPECQTFYNETVKLRKEFYDKKFEYFETLRNPKATGETAARLYKEMRDLHEKIFAKAPLGCRW